VRQRARSAPGVLRESLIMNLYEAYYCIVYFRMFSLFAPASA
jgi:hypothetical protein